MNNLENRRILIFLRSFDVGGAEKQAAMLANYLYEKEKAKVAIWAYSEPGPILKLLNKNIPWKSVRFDEASFNRPEERIKDLKKLALKILLFRPDALMPFTIGPNTDCGCIWRWTLAKTCIWNQRDEWLEFLDNPAKKIEKYGFANTPVFVSNSKKTREMILKQLARLKRPVNQVLYIPNAVKLEPAKLSRKEWRKKIQVDNDSTIVTMVGNLRKDKEHEALFKAWKLVLDKIKNPSNLFLLLAGRFDNNYQKLIKLAKDLSIEKQIRFLDYVEDVSGLLHASDIGVFLSRSEGCPNAVLESMEAKLPIVASNIEANRDIIGSNYPYLVSIDKPQEVADSLFELVKNKKLRATLSEENYLKIKNKFNPDIVFRKYSSVIQRLIYQYENLITPKNIFQIIKWQLSWKRPNLWESIS